LGYLSSTADTLKDTQKLYTPSLLRLLIDLLSSQESSVRTRAEKVYESYISTLSSATPSPSSTCTASKTQRYYAPKQQQTHARSDKKMIAAIANALFSIVGVAVAAWIYGAFITDSKETQTLIALASAGIVAVAEAWIIVRQIQELDRQEEEDKQKRSEDPSISDQKPNKIQNLKFD
jgi:hypothetical protein